jgi:hypothetical protein
MLNADAYSSRYWTDTPASSTAESLAGPRLTDFEFWISKYRVRFEGLERDRQKWKSIAERLHELASANENWDSYGASAIRTDALILAFEFLISAIAADAPIPFITRTANGGIHLEWSLNDRAVEIEINTETDQHALFIDDSIGTDEERTEFTGPGVVHFLFS